jgi:preprotein translocase subunit SecA
VSSENNRSRVVPLCDPVRNQIGWRERLARLQGSAVQFDLRYFDEPLREINRLEDDIRLLSDRSLEEHARELRGRAGTAASPDSTRAHIFALVREASRRTLGMRPFDVQVVAAIALDRGAIVEMLTGEGKTLAAVMPAVLNALTGRGVHVLTFNDYLARRDAEWMGPIFQMVGVSVGFVQQTMTAGERRRAYNADVTYVTAKEAGFDHLRDLLATDAEGLVHRPVHFAIVDEADSLLIDEARIPLVIAGSVGRERSSGPRLAELVDSLAAGVHFDMDEYGRDVELTEAGVERVERALECGSLHDEKNYTLLTELNCALHARALLRRDVDYLVRDGRIEIIDEFTGRVVPDRHWPDGLQAALEAKEGLERRPDGRILGSITLQHFLRGYPRLCGMTGTAQDAASELRELYGLDVVVIPTNRPMVRVDHPDVVFTHREAKEQALIEEIVRVHSTGRPVLVGTLTVEESERLAARLRAAHVTCEVLNAKNDATEARVVARAGGLRAVTISTNMAGRGTDIRLGGEDEADREAVAALGGLYVIGTNRHESRRVDLQLRGRAGRQGDPGESRFFVSLDDDLLVRYGIRSLIPAGVVPAASREAIDNPIVRREIARAQRIVEGQNFEIRKTLWRYASVVENERQEVMARRQAILQGCDVPDVWSRAPEGRAALVAAAGEEAVGRAERAVMLFHIDRAWRDHLSLCADLREGIHLVRLGGQDPLTRFTVQSMEAFRQIEDTIDDAVLDALDHVRIRDGRIDLEGLGIRGPSSTWTYLVNDDPFRNQIGLMLTGAGRTTIAIYSAIFLSPLLILWGLVDRLVRRRPGRRPDLWR